MASRHLQVRVSARPFPAPQVTAVLAQCLSMVGAHCTLVQGINLSVATPHPRLALSPGATPPMARATPLGLSVSEFACCKKITFQFLPRGLFLFSARGHSGQGGWLERRPRPLGSHHSASVNDSSFIRHPVESISSLLFWDIKNTLNIHEVSDKICT